MRGGRKIKAEKLMFKIFKNFKYKFLGLNICILFFLIFDLIKPCLDFILKRIGRRIHQVPVPIRFFRQYYLSLR